MHTLDTVSTAYASVTTSWDNIADATWTKLRLVRSAAGTPRDERDGDVLFEDNYGSARASYTDTELTTGRYYYYGLFLLTSSGWVGTSSTSVLVTKDWGYTTKLYNSLPEVFRSNDYDNVAEPEVSPEESFLYRFLSVFGYQLDALRTDTESMKSVLDATIANQELLPALSAQVGLTYEPEIGAQALRKLIANAIHLWGIKGTVPSIRELASVLTGYVTHVRIGKNLALDGLDSGPTTDRGHWRSLLARSTVGYRANAVTDNNPAGQGVRVITCTTAGTTSFGTNLGDTDAVLRRQSAIPVLPNTQYTVSSYFRTDVAGVSITPRITWLTANGTVISNVSPAAVAIGVGWSRLTHVNTSPAAARYMEVSYDSTALTVGQTYEHCGFQVEEGGAATTWQCARQVQIYFDPQVINYVANTSGAAPSNYGWSTGVEAAVDPTLGPYLVRFTPDPEDPSIVWYVDAFEVVVPGDAVPPAPPAEDSLAPTEVYYTAAHQAVTPGQVWTALAEARPPTTDGPADPLRYGRVGFRLYAGSTLVGHNMSDEVHLTRNVFTSMMHELIVPDGAAYDHIEVCIITEGPCGFRHVALEPVNQYAAFYFDGSTPSLTGDYLWSGTPFQSASYAFDRRSSRTVRLRALLLDFLPHGSCYDMFFIEPVPAASPQSIAGVNADPATSLPL